MTSENSRYLLMQSHYDGCFVVVFCTKSLGFCIFPYAKKLKNFKDEEYDYQCLISTELKELISSWEKIKANKKKENS
jgi:hypothetical protein